MISLFELFKIGIGPSSSHTVGPMTAVARFLSDARKITTDIDGSRLTITLFGSLAWTGVGHQTPEAIFAGLGGAKPETTNREEIDLLNRELSERKSIVLTDKANGERSLSLAFDPLTDLIFDKITTDLPHSNTIGFTIENEVGQIANFQYLSIGGGFVESLDEYSRRIAGNAPLQHSDVPHPFSSGKELLDIAQRTNTEIFRLQYENELSLINNQNGGQSGPQAFSEACAEIYHAMMSCIDTGISTDGVLPGGLNVKRRAKSLYHSLSQVSDNKPNPHQVMDWISLYAIAVNEENAIGGRVVTAPTNGAAGVIPAVLRYLADHCGHGSSEEYEKFLLTAAAFGSIIKQRASISGAEVGCQGEVGSAASMAAAGMTAVLGGTPLQIENAAEIAMEHHLGLTCDPIGGLVQIPCIERNAVGATKAIAAASLAMRGSGDHNVSFDHVVETMRRTGLDMSSNYKETSLGGLALNVVEC